MADFRWSGDFEAGVQYTQARYARAVAREIEQDMVDLCPVDTGQLRDSISAQQVGDTVYISVGSNGAYWWKFIEYGTSKMQAQPFIRPALNRRRNVVDL